MCAAALLTGKTSLTLLCTPAQLRFLTYFLSGRFAELTTMAAIASRNNASQQRPNHTLYCSNLPDKLQKNDLKRALYMLFSVYGPILDIVALKTPKMRGQAHVVYRDVSASTQAMRALQGTDFIGKQIVRHASLLDNPFFVAYIRRKSLMPPPSLILLPNWTVPTSSPPQPPPPILPQIKPAHFNNPSFRDRQALPHPPQPFQDLRPA